MKFNTAALHEGRELHEKYGSTLPPIYQSSAFEQETALQLERIFENKAPGYCYTRVANPTVTAFENRITKLERGIASVACASGMAALANAFLTILQSGDEIVTSASCKERAPGRIRSNSYNTDRKQRKCVDID